MSSDDRDDYLHEPTDDDYWWSETYWFSFDDPKTGISCHFYPLFRRNIGVAALQVFAWKPRTESLWTAPYYYGQWHLPCPQFDGNRLQLDKLCYEVLETQSKYRVTYDDPGRFVADLDISGVTEIFRPVPGDVYSGHIDQPTKVVGRIELGGQAIDLDCHGMRDRSWGPRPDDKDDARAYYFYGISDKMNFLVIDLIDRGGVKKIGFVDADGQRGRIVTANMTKSDDVVGRAIHVSCEVTDDLDRSFVFNGRTLNHFPVQANPHQFAWLSMIEWQDGKLYGQFQEVLGRERLAELARQKSAVVD